MADTVFGIYGFDFSEPFTVSQAELVPRHGFPECRSRAQDRTHLFLTGYGIFPEGPSVPISVGHFASLQLE